MTGINQHPNLSGFAERAEKENLIAALVRVGAAERHQLTGCTIRQLRDMARKNAYDRNQAEATRQAIEDARK